MTTFGPEIQVDDGTPLEVRNLTGAALGENDRFQFRGTPTASVQDSTGFGSVVVGPPADE